MGGLGGAALAILLGFVLVFALVLGGIVVSLSLLEELGCEGLLVEIVRMLGFDLEQAAVPCMVVVVLQMVLRTHRGGRC